MLQMVCEKLRIRVIGLICRWSIFIFAAAPILSSVALKENFYELMGSKHAVWQFLLQEDKAKLDQFASFFDRTPKLSSNKNHSIPTSLHFIWVGPKEFPMESIKNIDSWVKHHPEFEIYLWSDRERPLPNSCMKLRLVSDFNWLFLKELFFDSNNYAEQSDLLRYEILYQEGGIYVDHDVECFKPFSLFIDSFDLFCGLEFPHKPIDKTSLTINNNLIGACPKHPILKKAIELVLEKWNRYKHLYPGNDSDSVTHRVYHRTFSSFDDAVKDLFQSDAYRNMVFPAGYFNKLGKNLGLYSHHQYASTWFEKESVFEKNVRQKLVKICKKNNQIMLIVLAVFIFCFSVICALFIQIRALRKQLNRFYHKDHS